MKRIAACSLASGLIAGCTPVMEVSVAAMTNECLVDLDSERTTPFLLDIATADSLHVPFRLNHDLGEARFFDGDAAVFFVLDLGVLRDMPRSAETARTDAVHLPPAVTTGVRFAVSPLWSATVITTDEIAAFRVEPAVSSALQASSDRLAATAVLTFTGGLARFDNDEAIVDHIAVEPTTIEVPLELCSGCLATPLCDGPRSVLRSEGCFVGVDEAQVCVSSSQ